MSQTWSWRAVYAAICSLSIGCGTDTRLPPSELTRYGALRPDAGASVDSCEVKGGCACEQEGARVECGSVKEKVAGYTWCAVGEQVCSDGKWSPCVTDRVVLRKQTLTLSGLGESTSCADENPCSPGCNAFEDDGRGLVLEADAGLVESEGGLTLTPNRDLQGNGACESLEIVPDTAQIVLNELQLSAPSTVSLSLRALPEGCVDGTVSALWSVDRSDVASVVGDELSGDTAGSVGASAELNLHRPIAGPIEVSAFLGRLSASATVTVSVQVADTAAAPTGALGAFSESADDDAVDPTELLYPYADTVFPLGQPAPKLQWTSLAAVEASLWGSCALRNDGSVRCWGTNSYGALQERPGPYVALSSRYQHVCGLSPEGAIDCWGSNSHFQATDQPPTYVDVAAGNVHTCGLRADGTVECWGDNDYGQSEWQAGPYTQISAGAYHTCGLRANGDADCWGNDVAGQGGVYTGPFTSVQAGRNHACALRADRTLQCWGGGEYGENEVPAGDTPYEAISVGSEHNCALATDGTADCWGRNDYGQGESRPGPFVSVSAGGYHSCGLLETGAVECWGLESGGRTLGLPPAAVRIGLRYPESGSPLFEWSAIVPEYQGDFVDAPRNTRPMVAKPRYVIPNDVWRALEGAATGQAFLLSLQRFTGERLLAPVERRLHFSDAPLSGQIVYQSYGTRAVHNATGTYEDTSERWGAVQFAHDTRNGHSSLAAGFDSADSEAGANAGCRGCHSVSTFTGTLMTGFDGHRDAEVRLLTDLSAQPGELFSPRPREHGGFLWAAQHPFEPYAFTSRGPSPCATLAETGMGSCDSANFSSLSGDLIGASALVAAAPGGMVGAAWLDSDSDGVYESASENQLVALTSGALGVPMQTSGLPDDLRAAIPVFSPEGERLAFTHYAGSFTDGAGAVHSGDKRSLAMADYDVETQAFSNFQRITNVAEAPCDERYSADPCLDVWPSFVPSGAGIVYQREVFNNARVTNSVHADFGGTRSGCEQRGKRWMCDDRECFICQFFALGRAGRPDELGDVIAFLLSERAGYLTGATINVDGGTDF